MSTVYETGRAPELPKASEWRASKSAFDQYQSLDFDAATAAALSLALRQTRADAPGPSDCAAARGLMAFASALIRNKTYTADAPLHPEEAEPIRGLVTQVDNRIAAECGS